MFVVRKNKILRPKPRFVEYRSMKNFDHEKFLADLSEIPWGSAYCFSDVYDVWDHWSELFKDVLDRHAPIKKKWVRGNQLPWITPQIQHEIALRNRLFKRYRKNPTDNTWIACKQQRNKVTSLKRKGISKFCHDTASGAKHPGEFWKKIKPLLPNSGTNKQSNITLVENGVVTREPSQVVEIFNSYFTI